jgi:hypothetical protein
MSTAHAGPGGGRLPLGQGPRGAVRPGPLLRGRTDELLARLAGWAREEGRSDDTEETVRHRLEVFRRQTYPLLDYYRRRGVLVRVHAVGPVDAITERILAALHWHKANALADGADRPEWAFGAAEE